MSTLRLRIDKTLFGKPTRQPPQVYVRISRLGKGGSKAKSKSDSKEELVPISPQPRHTKSIHLGPGHYYVESVLPSGETLADDVLIPEDGTTELVLRGKPSPREWLSWQHLVGNVPSRGSRADLLIESSKSVWSQSKPTSSKAVGFKKRGAPTPAKRRRPPSTTRQPSIEFLSGSTKVPGSQTDIWTWLTQTAFKTAEEGVQKLNGGQTPLQVQSYKYDNSYALFRLSSVFTRAQTNAPSYVAVSRKETVELVSLPSQWVESTTGMRAEIEVAVLSRPDHEAFSVSATVLDEHLGMLLGYLSSGLLPAVRQRAEDAKELLYKKKANPFAATAGAYALVGTAVSTKDREWHPWVTNLKNWFPKIPDGPILHGQLLLRMRRNKADIEQAKEAFKDAYRRGLPCYSMGMRWLLDGLEWAATTDSEAADMVKKVRPIAWRTNYTQPFTVIKLGGDV